MDTTPPQEQPAFRRLLSRPQATTLAGMLLAAFSLFLPWDRITIGQGPEGPPNALYVHSMTISVRGFYITSVHWPITICALVAAASLVAAPTERNRIPVIAVHAAGGVACVLIALVHFAFQPGMMLALLGGVLISLGAYDRFIRDIVEAE